MLLFTGGKSYPKGNTVFMIGGSVGEILLKRATPNYYVQWMNEWRRPIPSQEVILGDLGRMGNDSRLYAVLADGETHNVTPQVRGKDFYAWSDPISYSMHKLVPTANGIDNWLDPDEVVPTARFVVGQPVTFEPAWVANYKYSGEPPDIASIEYQWHFDGTFVNDSSQPCTNGSVNYTKDASLLREKVCDNWWVSGSNPPIEYSARITESVAFSNGTQIMLSRSGLFSMARPIATLTSQTTTNEPPVNIGYFANELELLFGGTNSPGIVLTWTVTTPANGAGQVAITQLSNFVRRHTLDDPASTKQKYTSNGDYVLDKENVDPTPIGSSEIKSSSTFEDTPGTVLKADYKKKAADEQFQSYLVYKPSGGIWVTLRILPWNWSGSASKNMSVWSLDSGGTSSQNPGSTDSMEFPEWCDTFQAIIGRGPIPD
jgi:hypothetical protein